MSRFKRVTFRYCPGCRHAKTQLLMEMVGYDADCPGCDKYKFSDYMPTDRPVQWRRGRCRVISIGISTTEDDTIV